MNSCRYASDGDCDDGGPGSDYSECTPCTDCADCGPRAHCDFNVSPPPPPPGTQCNTWRTLRKTLPYCDAPGSGTRWSVDLGVELGPICGLTSEDEHGCCYIPLGYGGGPAFGTGCASACAKARRAGSDEEWCQHSDGAAYGNCFCGPVASG